MAFHYVSEIINVWDIFSSKFKILTNIGDYEIDFYGLAILNYLVGVHCE